MKSMLRKLVSFMVVLVLLFCGVLAFAETTNSAIVREALKSTVSIQGTGWAASGSIATDDGYIVTNAHVAEAATNGLLTVYLNDFTMLQARIVGIHTELDVAVLKVLSPEPLVSFIGDIEGDPDDMEEELKQYVMNTRFIFPGDQVFAIGNALGMLGWTVTAGVISSDARPDYFSESDALIFQIDASLNRGCSGGPVINRFGKLIGIVVGGIPPHWAENIAFLIPVKMFGEEVALMIEADRERLEVITDIYAYLEGEEPPEPKEPRKVIIQFEEIDESEEE